MPSPEYEALVAKVDRFAADVARRRDDLTCHAGCAGCCQVELSVSDVEADAVRRSLRSMSEEGRRRLGERLDHRGPCVLLDQEGRCSAYDARPLVCRTQGLPLRYPPDVVPLEAVMGRAGEADVTWCPLNFQGAPPAPADVLDAERVDRMLGLVNQRVSDHPLRRTALRAIVEEALAADAPLMR